MRERMTSIHGVSGSIPLRTSKKTRYQAVGFTEVWEKTTGLFEMRPTFKLTI